MNFTHEEEEEEGGSHKVNSNFGPTSSVCDILSQSVMDMTPYVYFYVGIHVCSGCTRNSQCYDCSCVCRTQVIILRLKKKFRTVLGLKDN